ncbi:MAG: response regulator [Candidatus Lindowbacteria bacterium]|nr:response regulator [Candidatus Lindowbacteria bacterium]
MSAKKRAPRVCVIDVNRDHVEEISVHLQSNGFRTIACYSPRGALGRIRRETPDAVVVEVILPGVSGFEIAARMEADRRLSRIPVFFITDIQNSAGDNHDYFPRPLDIPAFISALKQRTA